MWIWLCHCQNRLCTTENSECPVHSSLNKILDHRGLDKLCFQSAKRSSTMVASIGVWMLVALLTFYFIFDQHAVHYRCFLSCYLSTFQVVNGILGQTGSQPRHPFSLSACYTSAKSSDWIPMLCWLCCEYEVFRPHPRDKVYAGSLWLMQDLRYHVVVDVFTEISMHS